MFDDNAPPAPYCYAGKTCDERVFLGELTVIERSGTFIASL
jgi:hypothetical protein